MFPSLFDLGVLAINFSDVVVSKSAINPKCIIIKARKPVEWLLDHSSRLDFPIDWIDNVVIKYNTDNSISVIEK
jgi:hypothetical protein